jgi:hypothetical protein
MEDEVGRARVVTEATVEKGVREEMGTSATSGQGQLDQQVVVVAQTAGGHCSAGHEGAGVEDAVGHAAHQQHHHSVTWHSGMGVSTRSSTCRWFDIWQRHATLSCCRAGVDQATSVEMLQQVMVAQQRLHH